LKAYTWDVTTLVSRHRGTLEKVREQKKVTGPFIWREPVSRCGKKNGKEEKGREKKGGVPNNRSVSSVCRGGYERGGVLGEEVKKNPRQFFNGKTGLRFLLKGLCRFQSRTGAVISGEGFDRNRYGKGEGSKEGGGSWNRKNDSPQGP